MWVSSSAEASDIEQLIGLWSTGVVRVKRVSCSVKSSCATLSRWNQQRIWTSETYAKGTREPGSFYKMGMMLQSCCNCNQHYNYCHENTNYGNSYLISFKLNKIKTFISTESMPLSSLQCFYEISSAHHVESSSLAFISNSTITDVQVANGTALLRKLVSCRTGFSLMLRERFQSPFNYKTPSFSLHSPCLAKPFSANIQSSPSTAEIS